MLGITQKEMQKERLEICMACPSMKYVPVVQIAKCSECGCPIRTKIIPESSQCPKGKW
jgi:predicted Zn-ribbon and HTH transcriptional regulator